MRYSNNVPVFGQRYFLVLVAHVGLLLLYVMRVNLSVALIAMVNDTETRSASNNSECSVPSANSSSNTPTSKGEFDWSREIQGYILSSFFWGYIVLQIPGGTLAQRYGAKWFFGAGILWTAFLSLLTPLVARTSVYLFIAVRVLEGVGQGVILPSMMAMLGRWSPREESSLMNSLVNTGMTIGAIVGQAAVGPLCASTFMGGWPSAFYLSGALTVLWFIPWALLIYDSPEKHPRISLEEKNYILNSIGGYQEASNKSTIPWKHILLSRHVWAYILAHTLAGWASYTLLDCLPQFLSDVLHFDISANGLVASSPIIASCIFSNAFSWLNDIIVSRGLLGKTIAKKIFTAVSFAGCAACYFGVTVDSCNIGLVIGLLVLSDFLHSAENGGYVTAPLDLSPEYSGTIYGIANTFSTAAGIATPILTDYITVHKTVHEWNIVFYISVGVSVVGLLQFCILGSADHQHWGTDLTDTNEENEETRPLVVNKVII